MTQKENARQPWEAMRAHVRKHDASITRMTRSEAAGFFMLCTICGLLITIWGLLTL